MNFKSISLSAMLAGTAAAIVVVAPAQAASIGGEKLSITGTARLETPDAATSRLNFSSYDTAVGTSRIPDGSGNIFGADLTAITVKDLDLTKTGANTWSLTGGPVIDWLIGMDNDVKFTLGTFDLTEVIIDSRTFYDASVEGIFNPSNLDGTGSFSSQGNFKFDGASFSADITADEEIPTPALLPGLIGMGVAALRKRGSGEESVEA